MTTTVAPNRYPLVSIILHWGMLLLILAVYACILLCENYPKGSDFREGLKTWHFMLGLSVLVLVIVRIVARMLSTKPPITPQPPRWQRLFAKSIHYALYAFMLMMPVAGWVILSAAGKTIPFYGLELFPLVGQSKALSGQVLEVHETIGTIGYFLIGLHALAGLFHHYVVKDDTLRPDGPSAVARCRDAGIRVVMITGDYAAAARFIATEAGIAEGDLLTVAELDKLGDAGLAERLKTVSVFARIMPEQKLRIVQAFKADGEVVAMTGDGVNDAPSLKAAHIGIAMGKRGTDVAREAAAIVLLDDDFGSIVQSIRLGRSIYDNIRKAMAFIFAVHVPIAGLALMPLLFGMPILFRPIHIALLEMVIDPVCALVFEAERDEAGIMQRPPRAPREPLFSINMVVWSVFQGALAFAMLATAYLVETWAGMAENEIRALMFFALVSEILGLILVNRSFRSSLRQALSQHNAALRYVLIGIISFTSAILLWPDAQELLRFGSIAWSDIALAAGLGILLLLLLESCKSIASRIDLQPLKTTTMRG